MEIDTTKCLGKIEKELGLELKPLPKGCMVYDNHGFPIENPAQEYRPRLTNLAMNLNVLLYRARKKLGLR